MITRSDLQVLAGARLREADVLLRNQQYCGAYYLAGYAIELALKACIARSFLPNTIPHRAFVADIHTHDLSKLVGLAGLRAALDVACKDSGFAAQWGVVSKWDESSRYAMHDVVAATALVQSTQEVLRWAQQHW